METNSGVIHYKNRSDYLNRKPAVKETGENVVKEAATSHKKVPTEEASKVNISDEAKKKALAQKLDKKVGEEMSNKDRLKKAGNHLLNDAASTLLKNVSPPIPLGIPSSKGLDIKNKERIENGEKPIAPMDRPAVIFISGLDLTGISGGGGLESMADKIKGAEHYSWQDEDQVLEDILKRPSYQPVILVGHSLGGDSAVNIANKLNTLESGFRKVDLLVTLDSVGFDNDIIPQNVGNNLNFIGDKDVLFNDGPNIARDSDFTEVINELRGEDHVGIDDSHEIQFKIYTSIRDTLKAEELQRKFAREEMKRGITDNS